MWHLVLNIIDFGLVILVWLVQAIIYPSFQFIDKEKLFYWHNKYQKLISYFVLPLMLTQIGLSFFLLFREWHILQLIHFFLVSCIWLSTFFQAVPLHGKISREEDLNSSIPKLVKVNLLRTILWTITFIISFVVLLENIRF